MRKNFKSLMQNNTIEIVAAIVFSILSFYKSGFIFGFSNNVFHIPYVLDLANSTEFINDKLYQSLTYFTSLVWPILRFISTESNIYNVFYYSHIITRCLTFLAILYLIKANGITNKIKIFICLFILSFTPWLQGSSVVGWHDLFINFYSHTSVTWPFIFLALIFLQRNDLLKTALMIGIVFNINAFAGIWIVFISLTAIIYDRHKYSISTIIKSCALFVVVSMPTIVWIGVTLHDTWDADKVNFIEYAKVYFPYHFLIESATFYNLCRLLTIFACGILSCKLIENGKYWIGVQLGCFILFTIGIPLPYLFNSKLVFNLHLLRVDGIEQFIAILLTAIAATKLLSQKASIQSNMNGALIVFFLIFPYRDGRTDLSLLFIVIILVAAIIEITKDKNQKKYNKLLVVAKKYLLFEYFPLILVVLWYVLMNIISGFDPGYSKYAFAINLSIIFIFLCLLITPMHMLTYENNRKLIFVSLSLVFLITAIVGINHTHDSQNKYVAERKQWVEFTNKIRNSELHGIFLLSYSSQDYFFKYNATYNDFQLLARRKVWADWKQGAAVMWYPNFNRQWLPRFNDIRMLHNSKEIREYALKNDIDYFVLSDNIECPLLSSTVLSVGEYSLCKPLKE